MTENKAAKQTLQLLEGLKALKNSRSQEETERTIQSLVKLDFQVPFVTSDLGEELLRLCVFHCEKYTSLPTDLTKQLIWLLQTSAENQIALSAASLEVLVEFCLKDVLSQPVQETVLSFHALGSLVYQNCHLLYDSWPALHQVLRRCLHGNEDSVFLRHSALKVLQALTIRRNAECEYLMKSQVDAIAAMIIEGVIRKRSSADEIMNCKIRVAAMKILLNLANSSVSFQADHISYILGYLKHMTFYGFPGYAARAIRTFDLFPSPFCQQLPVIDINELEGNKDKPVMRRSHGKKQNSRAVKRETPADQADAQEDSDSTLSQRRYLPWLATDSSETETSDPENAQDPLYLNGKLTNLKAKTRQLAYDTLRMLLLTINKKDRFGYLLNFLPPQNPSSYRSTEHTLVLTMLKDPDAKVRTSAINVLKDFLANSKQYIMLASESNHATSFTSVSEVIAAVITELHRAIHMALLAESTPQFKLPLLSCLALLINATPYNRMRHSIVTDMISDLRQLLSSKYEQVRVAALTCFGGFAAHQPRHAEIIRCLGIDSDHWLEVQCIAKLDCPIEQEANSVKVEILQMLNAIVTNHFSYCTEIFSHLYIPTIVTTLTDPFGPIKIHGMKLVAALATQIANCSSAQNELVKELGIAMWSNTLFECGMIQKCVFPTEDLEVVDTPHEIRERQVLRRETYTALAEIGPVMWDSLICKNQKFCICALLTHARASTDDVALSAIRALGVICTYDCTAFDTILLQDVGELCVELLEQRINVSAKQKISWTLSNVCFALWTLYKVEPGRFLEEIRPDFFNNLLRISIVAYNEKDAVRVNALRAMGLLLGMVTDEYMQTDIQLYRTAVSLLQETMASSGDKFFKAKWNACYAIGWILKNPATRVLVDVGDSLKTLGDHLLDCINLKVQIACIAALDQLIEAHDLPLSVHMRIFDILLQKVSRVFETQVNYKELKHFQTVKESLCLSVLTYLWRSSDEMYANLLPLTTPHGKAFGILVRDSLSNLDVKRVLEEINRNPRTDQSSEMNKVLVDASNAVIDCGNFDPTQST